MVSARCRLERASLCRSMPSVICYRIIITTGNRIVGGCVYNCAHSEIYLETEGAFGQSLPRRTLDSSLVVAL